MKKPVILGKKIKVTSGGRHAWYESNVGVIRKPLPQEEISEMKRKKSLEEKY